MNWEILSDLIIYRRKFKMKFIYVDVIVLTKMIEFSIFIRFFLFEGYTLEII